MNHHCFISALDVAEQLPFSFVEGINLHDSLEKKKQSTEELEKFVHLLQKFMKEKVYHLGKDTINQKSYHRFMFEGPGFMEIVLEAPVAINAHFQSRQRARKFLTALKNSVRKILPPGPHCEVFLSSINIEDEHHVPLHLESISKIHDVRALLHKSVNLVVVSLAIFTILEFGEEAMTEIFRETFGINAVMVTVIISVIIALCLKPMKEGADKLVERVMFKR
ncbi:MAG TPA: hypothetical protein VJB66_03840 [Candidatus Nanoarchaeia archaeon]|nr:hypothetical protein [Candidatus Nanoarchaeia archaeon]